MDDAGAMRGVERVGDLDGDRERVRERQPRGRTPQPIGQRLAFENAP